MRLYFDILVELHDLIVSTNQQSNWPLVLLLSQYLIVWNKFYTVYAVNSYFLFIRYKLTRVRLVSILVLNQQCIYDIYKHNNSFWTIIMATIRISTPSMFYHQTLLCIKIQKVNSYNHVTVINQSLILYSGSIYYCCLDSNFYQHISPDSIVCP